MVCPGGDCKNVGPRENTRVGGVVSPPIVQEVSVYLLCKEGFGHVWRGGAAGLEGGVRTRSWVLWASTSVREQGAPQRHNRSH